MRKKSKNQIVLIGAIMTRLVTMSIFRLALAVAVLTSASFVRAEDDFRSAMKGAKSAEEALKLAEAYVRDHPKAADIVSASATLGRLYGMTGDNKKGLELLEKVYTEMEKGAKGDLRSAVGATQGIVNGYVATGDKKKAEVAIKRLKDDFKDHAEMTQAAQTIEGLSGELNKPTVGDTMEIAFTDLNDKKVDLAVLKGKVVLVDFWATWCGPCVGELPNVISAYKAYHEKGFEVIGISLDQDKEKLTSFIKEKEMPWPQFFDGKGWGNTLAAKYGIHSIPATFLIGKDGKVMASNLRGEALSKKLAEVLN